MIYVAIEKLLKGLVVQAEQEPLPIHDLLKLAVLAKLELTSAYHAWLKEITTFNIEARYDNEKLAFYKKATKAYATQWLGRSEEMILWLEKQLPSI